MGRRSALKALLPPPLRQWGARARSWLRITPLLLRYRWQAGRRDPHGLPGPLVVSIASYPPRFAHLHHTLHCLLGQTVAPDRLLLWVPTGTAAQLPRRVGRLARQGLDIRETTALGPHTKLLPALAAFPDSFIVTADDDVFYSADWLESLVAAHDGAAPTILCHRAHRLRMLDRGRIAPFDDWERDVQDAAAARASVDLIPTGVGGVLFPPGSLHADVLDTTLLRRLCPTTDDFWFWWQARRAGTLHRKIGERFTYIDWPGSQLESLHAANLGGGYDGQLAALATHYGLPPGLAEPCGPAALRERGPEASSLLD
jgi:hypothetical protein